MAGVRRRLRDVGKTVSGVLGMHLAEGPSAEPDGPEPALPQTGGQDAATGPLPVAPQEPSVPPVTVAELPAPDPVAAPEPVEPDAVLAAAVEQARSAAREVGGDHVGEHLGVTAEGPVDEGPVVAHAFATNDPAYVGWRWVATLARAEGTEQVTVDEVVLLPGASALLAPSWLPWSERVQGSDLSPGDLLPPASDDLRLVPSYAAPDGDDAALADAVFFELGLGRARVLSLDGRLEAAERWWDGDAGPDAPIAKQAPGRCVDCGFLVGLAGGLAQAFGVCANAFAPDDGRVVALSHGCGAHSETVVEPAHAATAGLVVEDDEFELVPTSDPAADLP